MFCITSCNLSYATRKTFHMLQEKRFREKHNVISLSINSQRRVLRRGFKKEHTCPEKKIFMIFQMFWYQWRIQRVLDAGIPVWAPKPCAQIIEKCLK